MLLTKLNVRYILSLSKDYQTYVRKIKGAISTMIVESDKIDQGKRIKIGGIIIIGTKPIPHKKYA